MKGLLIDSIDKRYTKLIALIESSVIGFKLPEESDLQGDFQNLDTFLSNGASSILSQIKERDFDYYIIPLSLTLTPLDFSGIRLSQHIRLTKELGSKQTLPIVFIGWLDLINVIKLTEVGQMVLASGNYYCRPIEAEILKLLNHGLVACKKVDDKVNIQSHNEAKSHHSTTNEWSILVLSQALGINEKIKEQTDYFRAQLYFKYLLAKAEIPTITVSSIPNFNLTGKKKKVFYIDDEYQKGWDEIFIKIFSGQANNIDYKCYKPHKQFTDFENAEELIKEVKKDIESFDPDIILLDLRLHDEDFDQHRTPSDMTGLKILREVKEKINPGIQIIVITASNKVWNLLELQNDGVDGFILKESPEIKPQIDQKYFITAFSKEIRKAVDQGFLKAIASNAKNVNEYLTKISSIGGGTGLMALSKMKLKNELNIQFAQAFQLLKDSHRDELNYSWAFLSMYKIFEHLNDYFIDYDTVKKQLIFNDTLQPLEDCQYQSRTHSYLFSPKATWDPYKTSTSVKLYNVLKKLSFDITNKRADVNLANKVYEYQVSRRKFVHPNDLADYQKLTKDDCLSISGTLSQVILRIA